jgi:hypothetical protein
MTNKPKAIGTAAESAVLKICLPYFPDAHRLVLAGQQDQGDIRLNRDWIVEVKGGAQTAQVGDKKLAGWVDELYAEIVHAGAANGFLVLQRAGFGKPNADRWWAYISLGCLVGMQTGEHIHSDIFDIMVRVELGQLLTVMLLARKTDAVPDAA